MKKPKEYKVVVTLHNGVKEEFIHEFAGGSDRECKKACIASIKRQMDYENIEVIKQ